MKKDLENRNILLIFVLSKTNTMQILDYKIETLMGSCNYPKGLNPLEWFLTNEQIAELNSIGYKGKTIDGKKTTRTEYLNSLFPNKEFFHVIQTKYDKGNFHEEFVIVRVIPAQPK